MPWRKIRRLRAKLASAREGRSFSVRNRQRWLDEVYGGFARRSRRDIFLGIARFAQINRPIDGYYLEFGSHEANTMRMAYDAFHHLFDWDYVAFDSFEGLPEIGEIDRQPIWAQGKLKTTESEFRALCRRHGIPDEKLHIVPGFYENTLTRETAEQFSDRKAAVVYVDCDLYESTVPVLRFVKPLLQRGTIVVFDDWNCFHGDPDKGERRAFAEFRAAEPRLRFEEFMTTAEAKAFIYLGES